MNINNSVPASSARSLDRSSITSILIKGVWAVSAFMATTEAQGTSAAVPNTEDATSNDLSILTLPLAGAFLGGSLAVGLSVCCALKHRLFSCKKSRLSEGDIVLKTVHISGEFSDDVKNDNSRSVLIYENKASFAAGTGIHKKYYPRYLRSVGVDPRSVKELLYMDNPGFNSSELSLAEIRTNPDDIVVEAALGESKKKLISAVKTTFEPESPKSLKVSPLLTETKSLMASRVSMSDLNAEDWLETAISVSQKNLMAARKIIFANSSGSGLNSAPTGAPLTRHSSVASLRSAILAPSSRHSSVVSLSSTLAPLASLAAVTLAPLSRHSSVVSLTAAATPSQLGKTPNVSNLSATAQPSLLGIETAAALLSNSALASVAATSLAQSSSAGSLNAAASLPMYNTFCASKGGFDEIDLSNDNDNALSALQTALLKKSKPSSTLSHWFDPQNKAVQCGEFVLCRFASMLGAGDPNFAADPNYPIRYDTLFTDFGLCFTTQFNMEFKSFQSKEAALSFMDQQDTGAMFVVTTQTFGGHHFAVYHNGEDWVSEDQINRFQVLKNKKTKFINKDNQYSNWIKIRNQEDLMVLIAFQKIQKTYGLSDTEKITECFQSWVDNSTHSNNAN